jgi:hypothetical protein
MGGSGSGNNYHWWRGRKKDVAEDCRSLSATWLTREGILRAGVYRAGLVSWGRESDLEENRSRICYEVDTVADRPWLRLHYTFTQTKEQVDYRIALTTTRPRFGGLRWWFVCPLSVNDRACGRRVGKLYLPPRGRYFGCRHCHRLTYRSAQEHDKRVDWLRNNPAALGRMLDNPKGMSVTRLCLALKAARRLW